MFLKVNLVFTFLIKLTLCHGDLNKNSFFVLLIIFKDTKHFSIAINIIQFQTNSTVF